MSTPRPEQLDPRGRLDVLAYQLAERIAPRIVNRDEWHILKDLVWETCQHVLRKFHDRT